MPYEFDQLFHYLADKAAELKLAAAGPRRGQFEQLFNELATEAAELKRIVISQRLWNETGGIVKHGLLKGYYLGERATWRPQDNAAKLLGLYEQEVCELIGRIAPGRSTLVDLGAADGFYGVGLIATNCFDQSYCYEIDDDSRENLRALAMAAGVADRVHLYGAATSSFAGDLQHAGVDFSDTVVLCDIEGAEFEVLTREALAAMRRAHVIVEIHDFQIPGGHGPALLTALVDRATEFFSIHEYRTSARDLSGVSVPAEHCADNDRWLTCSEGRAKLMSWLHFAPLTT